MDSIIPFTFDETSVRGMNRNGEPCFVLADVCRVLEIANPSHAATRLDDDEKADLVINEVSSNGVTQNRSFTIINESGLYSLILTSRKPAAKRFKKWVTAEVLPALRKTGRYAMPDADAPSPSLPAPLDLETAERWVALAQQVESLSGLDVARSLLARSPLFQGGGLVMPIQHAAFNGRECLQHLLSHTVGQRRIRDFVMSAYGEADSSGENRTALRTMGLSVDKGASVTWLLVANRHESLSKLFRRTPWASGRWVTELRQLGPDVRAVSRPMRFAGRISRATRIPVSYVPEA